VGGDFPYIITSNIVLTQKSTTTINDFLVYIVEDTVFFEAHITNDTCLRKVNFFINDKEYVSPDRKLYYDSYTSYDSIIINTISIDFLSWYNVDTLYVKAYGSVVEPYYNLYYNRYTDRITGETIWPGINYEGSSETIKFILP
jgi:hypothetical protein